MGLGAAEIGGDVFELTDRLLATADRSAGSGRHRFGHLDGHLIHYPFSKGVEQWFERHNSYSSFEAKELLKVRAGKRQPLGKLLSRDANDRRAALKDVYYRLAFRPQIKWLYYMLVRWAWLDGRPGMAYARMTYLYEYMITIKVMEEMARRRETGTTGGGASA